MTLSWTLLLLAAVAVAQYDNDRPYYGQKAANGSFYSPPSGITAPSDYPTNPTYKNGQQLNVTWTSGLPLMDLVLCQLYGNNSSVYENLSMGITDTHYTWIASNAVIHDGVVGPDMYFFLVNDANDWTTYFTSHFFNVTDDSDSPAPAATATASASVQNATGTGPGAQSTTAMPSSSPTNSGSGSGSNGQPVNNATSSKSVISGGAIAGVVIGVVAVVTLLAAAVWFLCAAKRKRGQAQAAKRARDEVVDAAAATDAHRMMAGKLYGKMQPGAVEVPDASNYAATPELSSPQYHALTAELPSRGYHGNAPVEVEAKPVSRR